MTEFERARQKYKPDKIKYLLIAESPPESDGKRFFYFENVTKHDNLYKETMKVLYPVQATDINYIRQNKKQFLERFKSDGFYLIDSTDIPLNQLGTGQKKRQIKNDLPRLIRKVNSLVSQDTPIILISSTVFECCYDELKSRGFNIINKGMVHFPLSNWAENFRASMGELLPHIELTTVTRLH